MRGAGSLAARRRSVLLVTTIGSFLNVFCDASLTFCCILRRFLICKIDPKLCPGGAWGVPRGLSGASRGTVRAHFETQLQINENFQGFWEAPGTSREPPGDPEGPQKSTPKRFFAKKGRSKREFSALFARKAVVQPFCIFFLFFS